ncbi:tRNA (adenosine(37)-N6)-threonylcarbamoyltransferase complex dimerization subunit type 1 TsaB [Rhodosalinus sp. 5P4]|uniref:tRNA (adenosine(37)-N6)-threonylcarbamoyltransferase complex dimerization subunit type 1 TsaB n=1 Tax=Rhodosalinus sp. 5P4 TaxID=3239196 RepID=UPI003525289F
MSDLAIGFDCSAAHCAAALVSEGRVLDAAAEEMGRGQAERLMPLLEELLARHGRAWRDLAVIGVGVGPGNFTGIRIAVAAARGLALALDIPAIGVTGFEAIGLDRCDAHLAVLPAPRDQLYAAAPGGMPRLIPSETPEDPARPFAFPPPAAELAAAIARIAAAKAHGAAPPPAPLYVRPADAAPARDAPPRLLDDA